MHVILINFEEVLILKYPDALVDELFRSHSVIVELQLESALVVGEVDPKRSYF